MPRAKPKPRVVFEHHSSFVLRVSCTSDKTLWTFFLHDLQTTERLEFGSLGALLDYLNTKRETARAKVLLEQISDSESG